MSDEQVSQANEAPPSGQQSAGKTFTQEQLDTIVADRLQRERGKYANYDELKKAAAKLKELETAQMSEAEQLQAQIRELESRNTELTRRSQMAEALAAASKAGAVYPDLVAVKIPAEALSDEKKLDAAVADLRKQYPALFSSRSGSADGGAGGGKPASGAGMNSFIRRAAGR